LLHKLLQFLDVQKRGDKVVISAHFQKTSADHWDVSLFNVFPRNCFLAYVEVAVDEIGEKAF